MNPPEIIATWPNDDTQALRRFEAKFDAISFNELLETAEELFLKRPLEYKIDTTPLSPEAQVVHQLGTKGIRMMYEVSKGIEIPKPYEDDENIERRVDVDMPYLIPDYFSEGLNFEALQKAEQFGAALTEQMFKILGQDAYDKVREFQAATTYEEQLRVIGWLTYRLWDITEKDTELTPAEDEDYTLYNPIRLSPKAIGQFPNINLPPTCLGVSIGLASFFKRAGVDYLHAGVMHTPKTGSLIRSGVFLTNLSDEASILYDASLPQPFLDDVSLMSDKMFEDAFKNNGYHAALYVPLKNGKWVQLDTNFNANTLVPAESSIELTEAHQFLTEMRDIAPGLEVTQEFGEYNSLAADMKKLLRASAGKGLAEPDTIKDFLQTMHVSYEALPQSILERYVQPFFNQEFNDEEMDVAVKNINQKMKYPENGHSETAISFYFHYAYEKYILAGTSVEEWVERCQNDPTYLERRIEDIQHLPLMISGLIVAGQFPLQEDDIATPMHPTVELGLPDIRIGLAVLSDLAVYTEESPSPTFWLSNWPSLVAATEVLHLPQTDGQYGIVENNKLLVEARGLNYMSSYVIVRSNSISDLEFEQEE